MAVEYTVYRLYDESGKSLYVGMTNNWERRRAQHRKDKPWFETVQREVFEMYPDRATAHNREVELIRSDVPEYNDRHKYTRRITTQEIGDMLGITRRAALKLAESGEFAGWMIDGEFYALWSYIEGYRLADFLPKRIYRRRPRKTPPAPCCTQEAPCSNDWSSSTSRSSSRP